MPIGRYFRGLSAYDLLGNLVPGVVGLLTFVGFTHNPPIPDSLGGFALFAAIAFIIGNVIQAHASEAVGKPRSFVRTMEGVESVPTLQRFANESDESQDAGSNDGEEKQMDQSSVDNSNMTHHSVVHAFFGPLGWWHFSEWGEELDDVILANRIWQHLIDTYEIQFETDKYGVLYHLMSSKIDGTDSPSRALRIQAIRNFNRGMWISSWYLFIVVTITMVLNWLFLPGEVACFGLIYTRPSHFTYWTPVWSLWLVSFLAIFLFWGLFQSSEEDYIEYLFTDYAVAITEGVGTELKLPQDSVQRSADLAHEGLPEELSLNSASVDEAEKKTTETDSSDEIKNDSPD